VIVTLEIPPESQEVIRRHGELSQDCQDALWEALGQASIRGAEEIGEAVLFAETVLTPRHGGAGLAGSILAWPLDRAALLYAVGISADSDAAVYAGALERGATIYPRTAKALAVPLTAEARLCESPRDMPGLTLIPRKGRPPLLVRTTKGGPRSGGGTFVPQWVLVPSVSLRRYAGWFTRAALAAREAIQDEFAARLAEYVARWST
jgi:hypothetical protein